MQIHENFDRCMMQTGKTDQTENVKKYSNHEMNVVNVVVINMEPYEMYLENEYDWMKDQMYESDQE